MCLDFSVFSKLEQIDALAHFLVIIADGIGAPDLAENPNLMALGDHINNIVAFVGSSYRSAIAIPLKEPRNVSWTH